MNQLDEQTLIGLIETWEATKPGVGAIQAFDRITRFIDSLQAMNKERLNKLYHIACVSPFIGPIAGKEAWLASVDKYTIPEDK